jgi:branched-chain amino acid transport system substrate-binding protein
VVDQQNSWAVGFKSTLPSAFRDQGGVMPDEEILSVTEETVDFNSAIAQLQKSNPQAWFVGLMGRQAGLFVQQAVARGIKGPFFGVDNLEQKEFVDAAGAAQTKAWLALPSVINSAAAVSFSAKYLQRFQRKPDPGAFEAYDAYFVMLGAVERAENLGRPVSGAAIQSQLKTTDFQGLTGRIQFDPHNDLMNVKYQRLTYDGKGHEIPVQ